MSKKLVLALVVVAALAAGTVLLAGYVDGPRPGATLTADSKCDDCPKEGTSACCKVAGECKEDGACASTCEQSTCAAKPAADVGAEKAQTGCCGVQKTAPCGQGGCALTE